MEEVSSGGEGRERVDSKWWEPKRVGVRLPRERRALLEREGETMRSSVRINKGGHRELMILGKI